MQKLIFIWEEITSTFWFLPIVIVIFSIGGSVGTIYIDNQIAFKPTGIFEYIFTGSADSARSVLSTISGAMIGVAGTVFSITLVALTLASSQFGPRLLRNFMHETINQVVLGTYVSTYVYCLIVLSSITENAEVTFVPTVSVFIAILAAVANIILLIIFIHHIAMSIQADKIISDISESLSKHISILFPDDLGEEPVGEKPDVAALEKTFSVKQRIKSPKNGYLQHIDSDIVYDLAIRRDMLVIFHYRPGDYLVLDSEIGLIYAHEQLSKKDADNFQDCFIIGKARTPQQDVEFSIHQMVEIAARALSPGINDPFTAIACIDNLTSVMCYLTKTKFPSKFRYDEEGNLRVVTDALTFEGMLDAAFNQIRQFGEGSPSVVIRLMEALIKINEFATMEEHKKALQQHAKMVLAVAEKSFDEEHDFKDMQERSRLIVYTEGA